MAGAPFGWMVLSSGVAFGALLVGAFALRVTGPRYAELNAYGQLLADALIFTFLIFLSGGHQSAFTFLYSLTVLNAAAVLHRRGAVTLATTSGALFAGLLMLEWFGVSSSGAIHSAGTLFRSFGVHAVALVLVAALASYLAEQVRQTGEALGRAEAQLEELEEIYQAVLESLPSGIITVGDAGRVLYSNAAAAQILGARSSAQLESRALPLPREVVDGPPGGRFEIAVPLDDGAQRIVGGTNAVLRGATGVSGQVVVFQDLTNIRALERDVERAERLATIGRFAAGLAHEIRNPLAAMSGCLDLLQAMPALSTEPQAARLFGIVNREAVRLGDLVTEFLEYARPRPLHRVRFDMALLVREVVEAVRHEACASTRFDVDGCEAPLWVVGDRDKVNQVVWNLLKNARAAAEGAFDAGASVDGVETLPPTADLEQAGAARVHVLLSCADGEASLIVDDSGPGIDPARRTDVFEPFFTTRPSGTGLGLSVVHQIIVAHDGRVRADVAPGLGGARFMITLPLPAEQD